MKFLESFVYVATRTLSVAYGISFIIFCIFSPVKDMPGGTAFLYVFLYLLAGFVFLSMLWAIDSLFTRIKRLERALEEKDKN